MKNRIPLALWFVCMTCLLCSHTVHGQANRKKTGYASGKPEDDFSKTQFYIGIRGGINLTGANPQQTYTSFISPTDPSKTYEKSYQNYSLPGAQVGLEFAFFFKGFTLSFQPNYRRES